jgi:hypothetical protein
VLAARLKNADVERWLGKFTLSTATGMASAVIGMAAKAIGQYLGVPIP